MLHNFKNTLLFVGTSALLFAGCGDDDPKTTPDATTADASTTDAAEDIDAGPDTTFSGTLSLAEVSITGPVAASLGGIGGATVNVSFVSPSDVTVAPQPGYTNNIGGCRIFVYDVAAGQAAPAGSDGGPVTITGTNSGEFACNYDAALDTYLCASTAAEASGAVTAAGTSATANGNGTVTVNLGGVNFGTFDPTGGSIILDGFDDDAMNGSFSVVLRPAPGTVVIANPAFVANVAATLNADSTYSTLVGTGPQPGGFDFLDDGTAQNVFTKAAATDAPEVNTMLQANGQGFALDTSTSSMPHAMPTDGTAVTFSCDSDDDPANANDTCGVDTGNPLKGMLIFGETTDGALNPLDPFGMPAPVSKYATYQCSAIGMKKFALDTGAMALILGTEPTRIQTTIVYSSAAIAGPNNLVVSHGVVGFTDVPSASK